MIYCNDEDGPPPPYIADASASSFVYPPILRAAAYDTTNHAQESIIQAIITMHLDSAVQASGSDPNLEDKCVL